MKPRRTSTQLLIAVIITAILSVVSLWVFDHPLSALVFAAVGMIDCGLFMLARLIERVSGEGQ